MDTHEPARLQLSLPIKTVGFALAYDFNGIVNRYSALIISTLIVFVRSERFFTVQTCFNVYVDSFCWPDIFKEVLYDVVSIRIVLLVHLRHNGDFTP